MMKLLDKIVLTVISVMIIPFSWITIELCCAANEIAIASKRKAGMSTDDLVNVLIYHPIKFLKAVWTEG